jgi:hypothetical protein
MSNRYEVVTTDGLVSAELRSPFETEISVIDTCNCGRVVATFFVRGHTIPTTSTNPMARDGYSRRLHEARLKAEEHASRLNAEERLWEAIEA